jgi:hypothetical protein
MSLLPHTSLFLCPKLCTCISVLTVYSYMCHSDDVISKLCSFSTHASGRVVPLPMLAMLSRRFIRYLWPRASNKAPRDLRNVLECLRNRIASVFVPIAAIPPIAGANFYSDLPTSSTLYRRTRLMTQYEKIKEQYKDYILLFQVGDFYEIYGEDAS